MIAKKWKATTIRVPGVRVADDLLDRDFTAAGPNQALAHRRPAPGLIWHSDQGSQFVSLAFGQQARAAASPNRWGSRGDCFDTAVAESFFATLKKELINRRTCPTRAELRTEVFDYIETFYNRAPPQSARTALSRRLREHGPKTARLRQVASAPLSGGLR